MVEPSMTLCGKGIQPYSRKVCHLHQHKMPMICQSSYPILSGSSPMGFLQSSFQNVWIWSSPDVSVMLLGNYGRHHQKYHKGKWLWKAELDCYNDIKVTNATHRIVLLNENTSLKSQKLIFLANYWSEFFMKQETQCF